MPLLTVYGRSQCHLCTEMLSALRPYQEQRGLEVAVVHIDDNAKLEARYGHKIPILVAEGVEICHGFLDDAALARHFGW